MTQQFALPDHSPPHNPRYSDAFVVFSVTVLSCAIGAWLLLRLGLALWMGSVAALGVYATLLSFHMLVRRSFVDSESQPAVAPVADKRMRRSPAPPQRRAPQPDPREARDADRQPAPATEAARWAEAAIPEPARPSDALPQPPVVDPFNFRPSREPSLAYPAVAPGSASPLPLGERQAIEPRRPTDASEPEISVDFVEESIKKLADALNVATTSRRPVPLPEHADDTDAIIGRSVAALQTAARTMHAPAGQADAGAPPAGAAAPAGQIPSWWPTPGTEQGPEGGAPAPGAPRSSIPSWRALPRLSQPSAWRSCSSRSMPWSRAGRGISR